MPTQNTGLVLKPQPFCSIKPKLHLTAENQIRIDTFKSNKLFLFR
jgi:hypothetical protein